jgi:GTP pyrophosphokinase
LDSVWDVGTLTAETNRACKRLAKLRADVVAGNVAFETMTDEEWSALYPDIELVESWRQLHARPLRNASVNLRHYVRPYSASRDVSVTQRLKKASTILDKQLRYPSMRLTKMEDVGGVRAILPTQESADEIARKLRRNWKIHRYRDYVREPKDSGYRALHLIAEKSGFKIEIQLRTFLQDYWANQVERDSRHQAVDFKSGKGHDAVHSYYVAMSELLAMREASKEPSQDFSIELRRRYMLARPFLTSQPDEETP